MSAISFDTIPVLGRDCIPVINGAEVVLVDFHPHTQYAIPFDNGSLLITNNNAVWGLGWDGIKMAIDEIEDDTPIEFSRMKGWLWEGLADLDKGAPINQVGYGYGFLARTPEGGFNGMLSKDFHYLNIRKEYDCANGCHTFATYGSARAIRSTIANIPVKQEAYDNLMFNNSIPYGHNDEIIFEGPVLIYGFQIRHGYNSSCLPGTCTVEMPRELQMECQTVGNYNPSEIKPIHRTFLCD